MISGIILMAGHGQRFGHPTPKQFHRLSGKEIYRHTLEAFEQSRLFDEIILVCHPEQIDPLQKAHPEHRVVAGGATRQASSHAGILASSADIVVIHDGARPFVDTRILKENIAMAKEHGAVDTCIPSNDTIVHSTNGQKIDSIPQRSHYWRGQTPQSFKRELIIKAHAHSTSSDATDDCQLVHQLNHPVHIVQGSERNVKITTELDLFLAEQLIRTGKTPALHEDISIKDKRYAIVGGNGDIGKAIRELLIHEGAATINIARDHSDYNTDTSKYEEMEKVFTDIEKNHGPLDGVINCVGKLMIKDVSSLSQEDIKELIDSNLMSAIYSCKAAKLKQGGAMINIASSSYYRGRALYALYSSAKAALVNFTQALAEERPEVFINALVPSRVNTKMRKNCFPNEDPSTLLSPTSVAESVIRLLKQKQLTGSVVEVRP